jgi:hypothetical protein
MAQLLYCWRCEADRPMLTEDEWCLVEPHLSEMIAQIKSYRQAHTCTLAEAKQVGIEALSSKAALAMYEEITGFKELDVEVLYHHRLCLFGPPCNFCGKPLRTPQAHHCAFCGVDRVEARPGYAC